MTGVSPALLFALLLGHSVEDAWLGIWRRLADRTGRPDPSGAQLQNAELQYLEYPLDLLQAAFPLGDEEAWRLTPTGARFFVQSLDEFELTNRAQLKTRTALGGDWSVDLRFDQQQDRWTQSQLLSLTLRKDHLADTRLFVEGTLYPRWEKIDADVMAVVGLRDDWGEVRLRTVAFDPFVDAAYALAESRDANLPDSQDQRDAPLGYALELLTLRRDVMRFEAYAGWIPRFTTARTTPRTDDGGGTRLHSRSGWIGGGLVEAGLADRAILGASAVFVSTQDRWTGLDPRTVDAHEVRLRNYAVLSLPARIRVRLDGLVIVRPDEVRDIETLRVTWQPGRAGAELGLMRGGRTIPDDVVTRFESDAAHRLTTRFTYLVAGRMWLAVGTGWDLDPGDTIYDGSGITMLLAY